MPFTDEQRRAVDRRGDGSLLVRAGAGTGKTSVLVERFVQAVLEDEIEVDAMLAITFTEKAAAEMKARIRARFIELGERACARDAEGAWISTIHGFCSRLLRAHALAAGVDPDYRVLDDLEAQRLGVDAFDGALEEFLTGGDPGRLEMVASYTPDRLREMVRTAYSHLRSRGQRRPTLPESQPPEPAGDERERLETAVRAALSELASAGDGTQVQRTIERMELCLGALGRLAPGALADPEELGKLGLAGRAGALLTAACTEYREALDAFLDLCVRDREYRDQSLVRALLALYDERYERLKRARSGLDFEDLELVARDLLSEHPGIRERYTGRFTHVLVDEFQDTNPLQNELLELIGGGRLFRVGDENQSIYRFRHADVEVFREHHTEAAAAGAAESVTVNFRSRGEVLDAIDMAFERVWGEGFEPLRAAPGARDEPPRVSPSVELLVVDKHKSRWEERLGAAGNGGGEPFGAAMRTATPWRACEARLLARRVDELIGLHGFRPGEVVLLMRATTHMSFYERALEERGVPTHVLGGRGFFGQQQVTDLRHWLAALANPLDELAVHSVMASPLVGASLDAVALVGVWARRLGRDPWWTLREAFGGDGSEGLLEELPEADRRRLEAFVERFSAEREAAPRVSLETLIDRAVTITGYDRAVLALPAGERRMANVRKLMRLAREFEAEEGRDLRGFIDSVAERELVQEREGEAPLEAEDLDAVRLMTIHRAKGLEFPVVCIADLGKDAREDHGSLRLSQDGSTGLRLASISGGTIKTAELERIRDEERNAGEEEEKRIFYVAATRAQEHLVLSGATDLDKRAKEKPLCEPMRWVWRAFCPGLPESGATGEAVDEYEGREVRVRWTRCAPDTVDEVLPEADRVPVREVQEEAPPPAVAPLELAAVAAPRALPVSRLSYSALESYGRCGYRFYLERALRLPAPGRAPGPPAGEGMSALLRGTIVHELLERLDFARPAAPRAEDVEGLIRSHHAPVEEADVADLTALVEGFVSSPLRERLAKAPRVRTELPFAFTLDAAGRSLLVNGVVDVHAAEDGRTLIVDYKSDPLEGRDPAALCEQSYSTQRLVYALAALHGGAERAEVAYLFLERPLEPVISVFERSDAADLERRLLELAGGVVEGRFEPTEQPHRDLCVTCPGQPALCSWPPERTLAELDVV